MWVEDLEGGCLGKKWMWKKEGEGQVIYIVPKASIRGPSKVLPSREIKLYY